MGTSPFILVLAGARETPGVLDALRLHRFCVLRAPDSPPVAQGDAVVTTRPVDVTAIVDVTHAFDTRTRARWVQTNMPYARVTRPLWQPEPGDRWHSVDTMEQAVAALPSGARVFATTGQDSARALSAHDAEVFLRQLSHHDHAPPPRCTFVCGAGPFDLAGEMALLRDLAIDVVLARNVGGPDSFPKIAAARALGLPVVLLRPPPVPAGPVLMSPEEVTAWADRL